MSEQRKLTEADHEKINHLLNTQSLENINLGLSLLEQTADVEDIQQIFTQQMLDELICQREPLRQARNIISKCPITSDLFVVTLSRYGLSELSDAAAENLSKLEGPLCLDSLTGLSDTAAEFLSRHKGESLSLGKLTELSDVAAESLSKYEGVLDLSGLREISQAAAQYLSRLDYPNLHIISWNLPLEIRHWLLTPKDRFREYLQSKGKRNTQQRRNLMELVCSRHEHFDADTLIDQLPRKGNAGYVSRPTVYRTLAEFVDAGLLHKFQLDGRAVYERISRNSTS